MSRRRDRQASAERLVIGRMAGVVLASFLAVVALAEALGLPSGLERLIEGVLLAVTAAGGMWWLMVRPLRRAAGEEAFHARLQRALGMAMSEEEALGAIRRSLEACVPGSPGEVLLADSSRAHLERAVAVGPGDAGPGCTVESPAGCAAVRRGQSMVFPSGEALDACPKLRGRPGGACSAVCVPIAVLGRSIGVVHVTAPDGDPPGREAVARLESLATQAGSRLGMLRAIARGELQAATDPLTGLLNRRSLEQRARALRGAGVPYAVAIADLDRFKALNDAHGHETGDRALRLFARELRAAVREADVVGRWGGEEFVVVFPGCRAEDAAQVVERVRERLRAALAAADTPPFTVSVGLADADGTDADLAALVTAADAALLRAKAEGRDRVVLATRPQPLEAAAA